MKRYIVGFALALAAIATTVFTVTASASNRAGTILIGIAAAKTGVLAPYDLQPGQAFQMRIDEINKAGGVLGKQIKVKWIDTKSDKALAATNAQELISNGAVAIIDTCDFDYSAPATFAARDKKIPGLSLCASSPKAATPAIVGDYGGSMGEGSDTEGVTMAEWIHKSFPKWKRAYVLKDLSLEYSQATADYFVARWKQLGGTISGEDTFTSGANLDLSSQVTRLRGAVGKTDVIFDGSWLPGGAQAVRAIRDAGINLPITSNNSDDGTLMTKVAGNISNYYAMGSVCIQSYCTGEPNAAVTKFFASFKKKYGVALTSSYPARGYDLASALVQAIKKAGTTDGPKVATTLWNLPKITTLSGNVRFTPTCHRPQPASHVVVKYTNGKAKVVERWFVKSIPSIKDGSPCGGKQIAVPK